MRFWVLMFSLFFFIACAKKYKGSSPSVDEGNGFFPTIGLILPTSLSTQVAEKLRGEARGSDPFASMYVLSEWGQRVSRIVEYSDAYLKSLNRAYLPEDFQEGTHELNSGNKISVKVAPWNAGGGYVRQALICYEGNPFLHLRWSIEKNKFRIVHDFRYLPHLSEISLKRELMMDLEYIKDLSTNDIQINLNVNGRVWQKPTDVGDDDGDFLVENIEIGKSSDNILTFSGVNDWLVAAEDFSPDYQGNTKGDIWLIGRVSPNGTSHYLVHRKFNVQNACRNAFDETAMNAGNWCYGARLMANGTSILILDQQDLAEAWSSLQSIPITKDENLRVVSMPTQLTCPSAPSL